MDNQQATLIELGWLAGIIDGEGYLGILIPKHFGESYEYAIPMLHICNTDEQIVLRAKRILDKIGITTYCRVQNVTYNENGKVVYRIQVKRRASMIKLLNAIGNLLTGNKFERGKLVIEFCNSRQNTFRKGKTHPYSDRELEIIEQIIPIQRKGASETIRKTQLERSEIVKVQRQRIHTLALRALCNCDNCGKPIIDSPSRLNGHKHHFCSLPCRYVFQRNNPTFTLGSKKPAIVMI